MGNYAGMMYFRGSLQECLDADATVSTNCGWPNDSTVNWANPRELKDGSFVIQAPVNGYEKFTPEQMMQGINLELVKNPEFKQEASY